MAFVVDPAKHLTAGPNPAETTTHIGQASWATGPRRCFECSAWGLDSPRRSGGQPCGKFTQLMGFTGPLVPASAAGCKYFQERA
jgi:hypothetical protein